MKKAGRACRLFIHLYEGAVQELLFQERQRCFYFFIAFFNIGNGFMQPFSGFSVNAVRQFMELFGVVRVLMGMKMIVHGKTPWRMINC